MTDAVANRLLRFRRTCRRRCRANVVVGDLVGGLSREAEVSNEAVAERIDPAVDRQRLPAAPRIADDGCLADVASLLDDVQLAESIEARRGIGFGVDGRSVTVLNVLHVAQPVVDQPERIAAVGRLDPAAAVMTADDDVLDPEHVDGVLQHRQAIQICVHHHVRHVPVNEQLAREKPDDFIGGHPAVGTADPEVSRRLLS